MPELSYAATSALLDLENSLGVTWSCMRKAHATTQAKRAELAAAFPGDIAPDASLVLFGSIARDEMTSGSDCDWILLADGPSVPEHQDCEHTISDRLVELGLPRPGRSGVFGRMVGSHDIIHNIGGEDDTNSNTTRRVLLLLESMPVGGRAAYDRVRRHILDRYLRDDRGLTKGGGNLRVPRFLLNDLTRYWRTITVDFVYKQRADAGRKWALRNVKLRMSRKLVFASGLLRCYFCQIDPGAEPARQALHGKQRDVGPMLTYMTSQLTQTPLELLARATMLPGVDPKLAVSIFASYNRFLSVLDDEDRRQELENMRESDMLTSPVWKEVRQFSADFHSGLLELFFRSNEQLHMLTEELGVF